MFPGKPRSSTQTTPEIVGDGANQYGADQYGANQYGVDKSMSTQSTTQLQVPMRSSMSQNPQPAATTMVTSAPRSVQEQDISSRLHAVESKQTMNGNTETLIPDIQASITRGQRSFDDALGLVINKGSIAHHFYNDQIIFNPQNGIHVITENTQSIFSLMETTLEYYDKNYPNGTRTYHTLFEQMLSASEDAALSQYQNQIEAISAGTKQYKLSETQRKIFVNGADIVKDSAAGAMTSGGVGKFMSLTKSAKGLGGILQKTGILSSAETLVGDMVPGGGTIMAGLKALSPLAGSMGTLANTAQDLATDMTEETSMVDKVIQKTMSAASSYLYDMDADSISEWVTYLQDGLNDRNMKTVKQKLEKDVKVLKAYKRAKYASFQYQTMKDASKDLTSTIAAIDLAPSKNPVSKMLNAVKETVVKAVSPSETNQDKVTSQMLTKNGIPQTLEGMSVNKFDETQIEEHMENCVKTYYYFYDNYIETLLGRKMSDVERKNIREKSLQQSDIGKELENVNVPEDKRRQVQIAKFFAQSTSLPSIMLAKTKGDEADNSIVEHKLLEELQDTHDLRVLEVKKFFFQMVALSKMYVRYQSTLDIYTQYLQASPNMKKLLLQSSSFVKYFKYHVFEKKGVVLQAILVDEKLDSSDYSRVLTKVIRLVEFDQEYVLNGFGNAKIKEEMSNFLSEEEMRNNTQRFSYEKIVADTEDIIDVEGKFMKLVGRSILYVKKIYSMKTKMKLIKTQFDLIQNQLQHIEEKQKINADFIYIKGYLEWMVYKKSPGSVKIEIDSLKEWYQLGTYREYATKCIFRYSKIPKSYGDIDINKLNSNGGVQELSSIQTSSKEDVERYILSIFQEEEKIKGLDKLITSINSKYISFQLSGGSWYSMECEKFDVFVKEQRVTKYTKVLNDNNIFSNVFTFDDITPLYPTFFYKVVEFILQHGQPKSTFKNIRDSFGGETEIKLVGGSATISESIKTPFDKLLQKKFLDDYWKEADKESYSIEDLRNDDVNLYSKNNSVKIHEYFKKIEMEWMKERMGLLSLNTLESFHENLEHFLRLQESKDVDNSRIQAISPYMRYMFHVVQEQLKIESILALGKNEPITANQVYSIVVENIFMIQFHIDESTSIRATSEISGLPMLLKNISKRKGEQEEHYKICIKIEEHFKSLKKQ